MFEALLRQIEKAQNEEILEEHVYTHKTVRKVEKRNIGNALRVLIGSVDQERNELLSSNDFEFETEQFEVLNADGEHKVEISKEDGLYKIVVLSE